MINTLIGLLLVTATCGYSQQSFQAQLFKDFNESSSVANRLVAESDVVIYRFFYLPKENHERSFMLELKIGTFVGPLLARESNYRLKIIEDGKIKAESTGKLSSTETENVLLAIVRSEIFSLPQGEQPLEADDGGGIHDLNKVLLSHSGF